MDDQEKKEKPAPRRRYKALKYKRTVALFKALLGGKCVVCGATEQLEIDHIDPATKEFELTKSNTYSRKKVMEELAKCQLLCKTCHLEKTKREKTKRERKREREKKGEKKKKRKRGREKEEKKRKKKRPQNRNQYLMALQKYFRDYILIYTFYISLAKLS